MRATRIFFKYLLVLFFVASGANHFLNPDFYINIMPDFLPLHRELVLLSGITEIIAGVMVAIPRISHWGAWFIIAHLLVFFAVHIDMIVHAEDYREEAPLAVLWIRIPIQFAFIAWAYWFTKGSAPVPVPVSPDSE